MPDNSTLASTQTDQATEQQTDSAQSDQPEQQVTVEDIGPCQKKVRIEVPESRITSAIDEQFAQVKDQASLPGFRPGKAPTRLLQKRFGKPIREDVKNKMIEQSLSQAIEEENLEILGEPDFDPKQIELPESGPLTYEIEMEVKPRFTLPDFSSLTVDRPTAHVSDEQVEDSLKGLLRQMGQTRNLSQEDQPGEIQEEDILTGPAKILAGQDANDDAEVLHEVEQDNVWVHGESADYRGHIAGVVIQDLGKRLVGKSLGHVERISTTGSDKHQQPQVQNQPITVVFTIEEAQRVDLAGIEQIAPLMGVEGEDGVRKMMREELESRAQQEQNQDMQGQVRDKLLDQIDFELPPNLLQRQIEATKDQHREELAKNESDPTSVEQQIADSDEADTNQAQRVIRQSLILGNAAQQLDVHVSENEVNQLISQQATQYGQRPQQVIADMRESGNLGIVQVQMREQRTLEKITEQVQVNDVDRKPGTNEDTQAQ